MTKTTTSFSPLRVVFLIIVCCCISTPIIIAAETATLSPHDHFCQGQWVTPEKHSAKPATYQIYATRTPYNHSDPTGSKQTFLNEACPTQRASYTCYYSRDNAVEHSEMLERRYFAVNEEEPNYSCQPFFPASFLSLVKNRRILFVGDSLMGQIWESLVCTLYTLEPSKVQTVFWITPDCTDRQCPYKPSDHGKHSNPTTNNPVHGNINKGYAAFKTSNVSLTFIFHPEYNEGGRLEEFIQSHHLTKDDIVLHSYGHFYNNEQEYRSMLEKGAADIKQIVTQNISGTSGRSNAAGGVGSLKRSKEASGPYIFFTHTSPQHFPSENGYFDYVYDKIRPCRPVTHMQSADPTKTTAVTHSTRPTSQALLPRSDWRNRILHETLKPLIDEHLVFMIPFAIGLQDQFDAHVEEGDCIHWCMPGSVFKYIHLMLFNAMRKFLHPLSTMDISSAATSKMNDAEDELQAAEDYDMTWALPPFLKNNMIVRYSHAREVYILQKGRLCQFDDIKSFISHGFDFSDVKNLQYHAVGEMPRGPMITVDTVLDP